MTEKPRDNRVIAGVLAFLAVLTGGILITRDNDRKDPVPPRTDTATTVVDTQPRTDTEWPGGIPPIPPVDTGGPVIPPDDPGEPTTPPEPAVPVPIETIPDTDSSKPGRTRPRIVGPVCDADSIARAKRYAEEPGYGYLANRCDLIVAWKATGEEITEFLANRGYDSPHADCQYRVVVPIPPDERSKGWNVFEIRDTTFEAFKDVKDEIYEPWVPGREQIEGVVWLPCLRNPQHVVNYGIRVSMRLSEVPAVQ